MENQLFSISDALKQAWKFTKENFFFLLIYQIILFIILGFLGTAQEKWEWSILHLLGWFIVILGKMGLYNSSLMIVDEQKPHFDQLYTNWRLLYSWIVASFIFGVAFVIGLMLFIVPGLYIWARYGFYPFIILDKNSGPLEALNLSAEITHGNRWHVFLLFFACTILDILGALFFGIGLLITIPITLLALAIVYRQLASRAKSAITPDESNKLT